MMAEEATSTQPTQQVQFIPLKLIHPFEGHPFRVSDDDELMQQTIDSIAHYGVLNPVIVRPDGDGYEMVSGHRRLRASELAGKDTIPAISREMTDDEAIIFLVDSNLQRESLLPSERAFAYRMKMDALRHQGKHTDLTSGQFGEKPATSISIVANDAGRSQRQVQRFIRLTELIPELLDMVDRKELAFNPAVELSFMKKSEQKKFLEAIDFAQNMPSLSQAQRLKKLSQDGVCTQEAMFSIMSEEKKSERDQITFRHDVLRKYFPKSYTPHQMEQIIIKLLEQWQKKRQRESSR